MLELIVVAEARLLFGYMIELMFEGCQEMATARRRGLATVATAYTKSTAAEIDWKAQGITPDLLGSPREKRIWTLREGLRTRPGGNGREVESRGIYRERPPELVGENQESCVFATRKTRAIVRAAGMKAFILKPNTNRNAPMSIGI